MTWEEAREQARIIFATVGGVDNPQPYANTSPTGRMKYIGYKDDRGHKHDMGQGLSWATAVREAKEAAKEARL